MQHQRARRPGQSGRGYANKPKYVIEERLPRGKVHRHTNADNVYIVRSGQGELVADGKVHTVRKDQVIFIPAGMPHSLSNVSDEPFEIFEIYAPAGSKFDFIAC